MSTENLALEWYIKETNGQIEHAGLTGGKRSWLEHEKHAKSNMIKRAKYAAGLSKFLKTEECQGEGDVCRKLEDGRTIHIFKREDVAPSIAEDLNTLQAALHALHDDNARNIVWSAIEHLDSLWQNRVDDFMH